MLPDPSFATTFKQPASAGFFLVVFVQKQLACTRNPCILHSSTTQPENKMNASELFANMDCMTEVPQAACAYDDNARGQLVRQSFYIAPNDTIYSLQLCDGTYTTITLRDDDEIIFRNRHPEYFRAN